MYKGVAMFTYIKKHWNIGKQIYGTHSWREFRRDVLHTTRVLRHKKEMQLFESYFDSYSADPTLLKRQPDLYELMSRTFLYKEITGHNTLIKLTNIRQLLRQIIMNKVNPAHFY